MNNILSFLIFITIVVQAKGILFDRFSGRKIEVAQSKELRLRNATERCSVEIKPCMPHEGSRVDGTCNNYKDPSKGAARGPYIRLLKPDYANKRDIRKNRHGEPLPSARKVRTTLQTTGRVEDMTTFTVAATHMMEFVHRDVSLLKESINYLRMQQNCCLETEKSDSHCIPISVPKDDPYLKVTDITCLNFSRAVTFQDSGCTPEIIPLEQVNFQTPLLDLSTIYGVDENALSKIRKGEKGLLILELRGDRYVPLNHNGIRSDTVTDKNNVIKRGKSDVTGKENTTESNNVIDTIDTQTEVAVTTIAQNVQEQDVCIHNKENETTCYQFGFPEAGNYGLRTTTLGIFFMREHNRIATALHKINSCWKDDRLFKVARQINIATAANIFMYELLPPILGYRNMLNYGLLSSHVEQVSTYEDVPPLIYAEFEIAIRFFHTMLDGRIKKYTEKHHYNGEFSISETLYRQALIEQDKNFEEINRGTFYQRAGKIDDIQDPEISEYFYGGLQRAHDLAAIDIERGRDMGIRGYNEYRHLCGLKPAKKFEDLIDVMDAEKMEALKHLYKEVDDIDLLAGIISENSIQGTYVGPTLFCILAKQLQVFRYSDRFWYERGDQFHSFSVGQLHEIRKTSMARLACDNAEGIKHIQPQAFFNVKPGNSPMPCTYIEGPDLTKWRDNSCFQPKYSHEATHVPMSYMVQGENFSTFFDDLLFYKPELIKINKMTPDKA